MTTTKKRNLFEEIKQGILEINEHKSEKITLRTYKVKKKAAGLDTYARKVRTRKISTK